MISGEEVGEEVFSFFFLVLLWGLTVILRGELLFWENGCGFVIERGVESCVFWDSEYSTVAMRVRVCLRLVR